MRGGEDREAIRPGCVCTGVLMSHYAFCSASPFVEETRKSGRMEELYSCKPLAGVHCNQLDQDIIRSYSEQCVYMCHSPASSTDCHTVSLCSDKSPHCQHPAPLMNHKYICESNAFQAQSLSQTYGKAMCKASGSIFVSISGQSFL